MEGIQALNCINFVVTFLFLLGIEIEIAHG